MVYFQKVEADYFYSGKKTHRKTDGVIYPYNFCLLDFFEKSKSRLKGSYIKKLCLLDFLKQQASGGHFSHLKFSYDVFVWWDCKIV